ncbi:hypothetical protein KW843_02755 [Acidovorax sp. sif1233]|uniref:hypothetical protein n=1 Tax=Acidovorax sp. sif1233 TaxID=2854792 RepID=UPI001C48F81D|nr:hypothetical protein [Acidovorax sp. sif1233]MBV7453382.1 hypothetical protein [Acidovorax sp. sif1233]
MNIHITIAQKVPQEAFERVLDVMRCLQQTDANFDGVAIAVTRGPVEEFVVTDTVDSLRENLLRLVVEDALKGGFVNAPRSAQGARHAMND